MKQQHDGNCTAPLKTYVLGTVHDRTERETGAKHALTGMKSTPVPLAVVPLCQCSEDCC